jgi:hypothetical protein
MKGVNMSQQNIKTKPFTLQIPLDLLREIDTAVLPEVRKRERVPVKRNYVITKALRHYCDYILRPETITQ